MTESRIEKLTRIGQEMAAAVAEMRAAAADVTSQNPETAALVEELSVTCDRWSQWEEVAAVALTHLQSAGRLIPAGGMALTAEQVEDVRTVLGLNGSQDIKVVIDAQARLRALFPATEPAGQAAREGDCALLATHDGPCRPAPAEPAEEETKTEGPASHCWDMEAYAAGSNAGFDEAMRQTSGVDVDDEITEPWSRTEFAVMSEVGDRVFEIDWDRGGTEEALDCIVGGRLVTRDVYYGAWRLVDADPTSSPVVPAPTETGTAYAASCETDYPELAADLRARLNEKEAAAPTEAGPWETLQDVPEGVTRVLDSECELWVQEGGQWFSICQLHNPAEYAPFVAAEEG